MIPEGDLSAQSLNDHCACRTLNKTHLRQHLSERSIFEDLEQEVFLTRPYLFSETTVFISQEDFEAIQQLIQTVEETITLSTFQAQSLASAPIVARINFGPQGVFMGYDFHLRQSGPRLIEINSNAGGAYLNTILALAQDPCHTPPIAQADIEEVFIQTFLKEWKNQRGDALLHTIAIIDDDPKSQFLYPEFLLFQKLFETHKIRCLIADPRDLIHRDGKLYLGLTPIDLVYNRLTDFYFEQSHHQVLKEAYLLNQVVVTPNPYHHALFANKKNLTLLSDENQLNSLGLSQKAKRIMLTCIPPTQKVSMERADEFWKERKHLFFKPACGYGSKATYRGDKITKKVWEDILQGDYVAQEFVPPGERLIEIDGEKVRLKLDLRAYTYHGDIQLLAARLYSGQTTNFRTKGGGFAPVSVLKNPLKSNT